MRLFVFTFILILFSLSSNNVFAAELPVRAGQHDEYSRLVFDWPASTKYKATQTDPETISIEFEADATLDKEKLSQAKLSNIKAISIITESPLKISVVIQKDSKIRDLTVGNRVILDVYNPPSGSAAPQPLKLEMADNENNEAEEPKAAEEQPQDVKEETAKEENNGPGQMPETPDKEVTEALEEELQPPPIQIKARAKPTMITMSSTTSFAFASFVHEGRIWTVTDRDDTLLTPQISGPDKDKIGPLTQVEYSPPEGSDTIAKVYSGPIPENINIMGQGSDVLWRVLTSPDLSMKDPVMPERRQVNPQMGRSGRLIFPLETARQVIELEDDITGEKIFVVPVEESRDFSGEFQEYVDFNVLRSPIGLAVLPKVDDLTVNKIRGGVEISRAGGLALSEEAKARIALHMSAKAEEGEDSKVTVQRVFDFNSWQMGGLDNLQENRTTILGRLKDLPPKARIDNILTLGKSYLSNNMGPEALGILNLAAQQQPLITKSAEFMALTGAAKTLSRRSAEGFADLSHKDIKTFPEINLWRAYALSDLGDWQQASELMPQEVVQILEEYPDVMRFRVALNAAEIALRSGDTKLAGEIMALIDEKSKKLLPPWMAAYKYLKGEKARQEGDTETTEQIWRMLSDGDDKLYRAKSGLALTRLKMEKDNLSHKKTIDRLERLRYAWRGDDLEAQINYWLGRIYFLDGEYVKGMNIMRDAVTYTNHPPLSQRIANDMSDTFIDLFVERNLEGVTPLDAVTLYEQFSELVPPNERGNQVVELLAEHLVKADLLGRAGDLLNHQVNHRLEGYEAFRIATRLAAIRLVDNRPDDAMKALNKAKTLLENLPEELKTDKREQGIKLLTARALSQQGSPDQGLGLLLELEIAPEVNRLRADIAWNASYWDDAAEALNDVIKDQDISLTRPLTEENKSLLLQRAVALNLSNDRVALAQMREKYSELMQQTDKAQVFEVISRPRQNITLSDRETLLSIVSEVDLFESILNGIKNGDG